MKSTFNFLFFNILAIVAIAQPALSWKKSLGGLKDDVFHAVTQTPGGGLVFAGQTNSNDNLFSSNHGGTDMLVAKVSENGNLEWLKTYGGSSADIALSIQPTSDGGLILAGKSESTNGDFIVNNGRADACVLKLDAFGNIQWQKSIGGLNMEQASHIIQTTDGGFILAGTTESKDGIYSNVKGLFDCLVVKLDMSGNVVWHKTYGGTRSDLAKKVVQTATGYMVLCITDSQDGDVVENHGPITTHDFWLLNLSESGEILWQKSYGGNSIDKPQVLIASTDGGYVLAGSATSDDGDVGETTLYYDAWAFKINATGDILWRSALGGTNHEYFKGGVQTLDGGYVLAGTTGTPDDGDVSGNHGNDDFWVVKLSASGNFEWQQCLGGTHDDVAYDVSNTSDGGFVVTGFTKSNDQQVGASLGGWDAWTVKYEPEFVGVFSEPKGAFNRLDIYPNPASQKTKIYTGVTGPHFISIADATGRVVWQQQATDGAEIELATLANGWYTITAQIADNPLFVNKLQIQK